MNRRFNVAFLDGDEILYNVGFASQHKWWCVYVDQEEEDGWIARFKYKKQAVEWINGQEDLHLHSETIYDNLHLALYNTRQYINRIIKDTRANDILIFFTGSNNFRNDVGTIKKYKGNRDDAEKPFYYDEIKKFILNNYRCEEVAHLEADDLLAISGWNEYSRVNGDEEKHNVIICTKDKDLDMVPGWRYNSHSRELFWVDVVKGRVSFYLQLLKGDGTDNIPGLYHVTGKKALKQYKDDIINSESEEEMYANVWYTYWFNSNMTEKEVDVVLLEIGNLLWMRRDFDEWWMAPVMWWDK